MTRPTMPHVLEELDREANRELLAINRACPIEADFTFYFDRGADFFAWPDAVFDDYWYAGIRDAERLVGYCMAGHRHGWTGAEWGTWFYIGDARVLPRYRGHGLAQRAALNFKQINPERVRLGIALVKKGNAPAERIVRTADPTLFVRRKLCDFEVANFPLLFAPRAPTGVAVRQARWRDAEAVAALMRGAYERRLLAPRVDEGWIRRTWSRPGLGPADHLVAERGGRLVGIVGLRDLAPMRRTRVLGYPWRAQLLRVVYGLLRHFPGAGAPPLPPPGEAFRSVTAVDVAVERNDPAVLRALLATAIPAYRARGYHLLHLGFAVGDSLRSATRGLPSQRFRSDIHLFVRPDHAPAAADAAPPVIDLAMI
jgi:hypothetical protein